MGVDSKTNLRGNFPKEKNWRYKLTDVSNRNRNTRRSLRYSTTRFVELLILNDPVTLLIVKSCLNFDLSGLCFKINFVLVGSCSQIPKHVWRR